MLDEANIREFIEHSLRPKTRVDGGDIEAGAVIADFVAVGQGDEVRHQKGFTMTMMTMMNIRTVGTSLAKR